MARLIRLRVTCIIKPHPDSPYEAIEAIGGEGWLHQRGEAVANIMKGTCAYYVESEDGIVEIKLYNGIYLRSERDGAATNNLLELGPCPF